MSEGRFEGRTVLVSGGARGMGASHAAGFHAEGAKVIIGDLLVEEGKATAAELGDNAIFVELDVTDQGSWERAVATGEDRFGPLSVLVNNAGILAFESIEESDPVSWRRQIDVNLTGQYLGMRAAIPSLRRGGGGVILNVSSAGAFIGAAYSSAYIASKWAIRGLTKTAALELGPEGIRVNSIHPGYTRTDMVADQIGAYPAETFAIPRLGEPADITKLVLFVASDDAAFSTGSEFSADGGLVLGPAVAPPGAE